LAKRFHTLTTIIRNLSLYFFLSISLVSVSSRQEHLSSPLLSFIYPSIMYTNNDNSADDDEYSFAYDIEPKMPATSWGAKGTAPGGGGNAPPGTSMQQPSSRMGTGAATEARPMTSVSGAGYNSGGKSGGGGGRQFDPLNQGRGAAPALAEKADNSAEDLAKEMEKQVSYLN
jgi:hypothetical protein